MSRPHILANVRFAAFPTLPQGASAWSDVRQKAGPQLWVWINALRRNRTITKQQPALAVENG